MRAFENVNLQRIGVKKKKREREKERVKENNKGNLEMNYYTKGHYFNSHYVMTLVCELMLSTLDAPSPKHSIR